MSSDKNDERKLRDMFGRFPTGVTVITTVDAGANPIGLTVSSFTSVSLDPPLILWCMGRDSNMLAEFETCTHFAVNILAADQADVARRFAMPSDNRFEGIACEHGEGGVPLLTGCAARLQCRNTAQHDGGDHVIFLGEVTDFDQTDKPSLAFSRGQYTATSELQVPDDSGA
ncbi:MAG: flavin reductase family protein [Candidatus Hydrogenedentes bacterium]|nr:flavin reductase family protein [Candidatus Hydrogenedentota bacterium]